MGITRWGILSTSNINRLVLEGARGAVRPANSYTLELENVSAAIRGEAPLVLGREDARGQALTIEALYDSASA